MEDPGIYCIILHICIEIRKWIVFYEELVKTTVQLVFSTPTAGMIILSGPYS